MSKILVGIEVRSWKNKDTGVDNACTVLHMIEQDVINENVLGQRVIQETLWGVNNIDSIDRVGNLDIGCKINVYYEGEGNFKRCTLIKCESVGKK